MGENSILENSIFLYDSNMSNSNTHNNFPLLSVVLGGGAGALKGNQHLVYAPPLLPGWDHGVID